jgi:ABC-type cobalamin/Fe3+-siderophores transport system ATPase subunit
MEEINELKNPKYFCLLVLDEPIYHLDISSKEMVEVCQP